jgi:hypothetical protein
MTPREWPSIPFRFTLSRMHADGSGSADVPVRSLRRPAEGIGAFAMAHQIVNRFDSGGSRRDAD